MNTLNLISSDDDVAERSSVLENENRIAITALGLTGAGDTAIVRLVAAVEAAGDGLGFVVGYAALGVGDWEVGRSSDVGSALVTLCAGDSEGGSQDETCSETHLRDRSWSWRSRIENWMCSVQ